MTYNLIEGLIASRAITLAKAVGLAQTAAANVDNYTDVPEATRQAAANIIRNVFMAPEYIAIEPNSPEQTRKAQELRERLAGRGAEALGAPCNYRNPQREQ